MDDGIESFLFNFDSRDEVAALVKDIKRGVIPQSLSWHYDRPVESSVLLGSNQK